MGVEYVNRKDDRYYLLQGKTKTGKPKYYCSRKPIGEAVEAMPEGYEWWENPREGIVSVRKIRPSRILPIERELLNQAIRGQADLPAVIVDVDSDSLVLYASDRSAGDVADRLQELVGTRMVTNSMRDWYIGNSHYSEMLKFELHSADQRTFTASRWCFRGAIDDWIFLSGPAPLAMLISRYVPHLGRESFFELF